MSKTINELMDVEIENIRRFATMVNGSIDIIRKFIYSDFDLNYETQFGIEGTMTRKGYVINAKMTIPLSFKIEIKENSIKDKDIKPFLVMENSYGKITSHINSNDIVKYDLVEFELALLGYWYDWYTKEWLAPYKF
jgi:hypothetical protein